MKYVRGFLLWLAVAAPGVSPAQDEPAADEPAAETGEVLEAVTEDAATEEVSPEAAAVDTVPVDTGEETADSEPAEPWRFYVGVDQASTTLSLSNLPPNTPNEFDSGIYRLRAGAWLNENVSVELHYGIDQSAGAPDEVATERYFGAFLVPSTNLFDTFELAFPVGFAKSTVEGEGFDSVAFGVAAELPVQYHLESLPDLRLTLGWMTYYQKSDARLYGLNFGLRLDFQLDGLTGLDLWPFGGESEDS